MNVRQHSITGLIPLINALEAQGQDPAALFEKRGLSLDAMIGSAVIDQKLELEIASDAINLLDDPMLGIKEGRQITFASYGPLAMLVMTAPTLLDACRVGEQFQALSLLFSHMTVHINKDWTELRYTLPKTTARLKHFIADRELIGIYMFLQEVLENPLDVPILSGTARPKPANIHINTYRQYLGFEPLFDQPYNWFRLPSSVVKQKLKHSNVLVHKVYRIQAYELMRKFFPDADDIEAQLKQVIAGYESHYPTAREIAKMFGVSESTLSRKLNNSQTSYRKILDGHKKNRALDMLSRKDIPVSELADSLGYAESASFLRAFKRWTGSTPKQYVKKD